MRLKNETFYRRVVVGADPYTRNRSSSTNWNLQTAYKKACCA